jgi:hypothetical protein
MTTGSGIGERGTMGQLCLVREQGGHTQQNQRNLQLLSQSQQPRLRGFQIDGSHGSDRVRVQAELMQTGFYKLQQLEGCAAASAADANDQ